MNQPTNTSHKTALVTGANAGLDFEAPAQLADDGWGKVILACRSVDKAEAARKHSHQLTPNQSDAGGTDIVSRSQRTQFPLIGTRLLL
jgi:NADP-dependent 3-hydroxy acid dehydrogenase YdfG